MIIIVGTIKIAIRHIAARTKIRIERNIRVPKVRQRHCDGNVIFIAAGLLNVQQIKIRVVFKRHFAPQRVGDFRQIIKVRIISGSNQIAIAITDFQTLPGATEREACAIGRSRLSGYQAWQNPDTVN